MLHTYRITTALGCAAAATSCASTGASAGIPSACDRSA